MYQLLYHNLNSDHYRYHIRHSTRGCLRLRGGRGSQVYRGISRDPDAYAGGHPVGCAVFCALRSCEVLGSATRISASPLKPPCLVRSGAIRRETGFCLEGRGCLEDNLAAEGRKPQRYEDGPAATER